MSERWWDLYERLGLAIGDNLGRLAAAIVVAFVALFTVGVVV